MWYTLISQIPGLQRFAATTPCPVTEVYQIPTWYKYLPQTVDATGKCVIDTNSITLASPEGFLVVGIAIIEILLRTAVLVAIGFIIYAGFTYLTSNGDPERARQGKDAILNALIGLVIAIMATALVGFIGNSLT